MYSFLYYGVKQRLTDVWSRTNGDYPNTDTILIQIEYYLREMPERKSVSLYRNIKYGYSSSM